MAGASSPGERLGEYELLHELKSGGMGSVYLARKRATGGFEKLLAIKTIRAELSSRSELRTMFLDEARLLARLEHPAVAQVYDFGEQEDTLFLAMEYVAGVRFTDLARAGTPPGLAIRLIADVCLALHAAHQLRDLDGQALEIVHRDVSPDNLMLSYDGHVKVLDFGIALMRGRQAPVTEYGTIKGKPPYLSPEQVKGHRIDRRADIWSVGVVLWELLTGTFLFRGDSIYTVALAIEEDEIQAPSALCGQLPEGLDDIVLRALARNVEDRYQNAEEMAADLLAIASSIAAPSTADFAGAALAQEREAHRVWLREVLGGNAKAKPIGRATGMLTIPAEPLPLSEDSGAGQAEERAVVAMVGEAEGHGPDSKGGARWRLLALALLVPLMGVIAWLGLDGEPNSKPVFSGQLDSGVIAQPIVVVEKTSATPDAGALAVQAEDAGTAPDARKRRMATGRKRDKPRLDVPPPKDPTPKDPTPKDLTPNSSGGFGTMTIAAEPFALVRIDGKEIGSTPLIKKKFPSGSHVVELIHPDTGKVRLRRTVNLPEGAHKSVIDR